VLYLNCRYPMPGGLAGEHSCIPDIYSGRRDRQSRRAAPEEWIKV
jgi:hypothetical protein